MHSKGHIVRQVIRDNSTTEASQQFLLLQQMFMSYSKTIANVHKEMKKELTHLTVCEQMANNLMLLSIASNRDEILRKRGMVFDDSVRALCR